MDYAKYLRNWAAEMTEFVLTAHEPASSEFFKLAALCRDSADRIERSRGGRSWSHSRKESASNSSAPPARPSEKGVQPEEVPSGERLSPPLLPD
jgi:hypothetical protein